MPVARISKVIEVESVVETSTEVAKHLIIEQTSLYYGAKMKHLNFRTMTFLKPFPPRNLQLVI